MGFCNMKIQGISSNYFINNRKVQNPFVKRQNQQGDVFVSFKSSQDEEFIQKKKFGISDYNALTDFEKVLLKNTCNSEDKRRANVNVELALDIKNQLDGIYGENEYVFECIGTSPSPIARVMEFMGVETHYFPISNLVAYNFDKAKEEVEKDPIGKQKYSDYLASQGVKPNMLEEDDRTFIFYDFTSTGRSLALAKDLLEDCYDIPISYRIRYRSLNNDLHMLYDDELFTNERQQCRIMEDFPREKDVSKKCRIVLNYIKKNLLEGEASLYGGVPHLSLSNLKDINEVETDILHRPLEHKYNFLVIDKLNQMGLLKENPANKVSL